MALALADICIKVNRKRLNELAAMMELHTPHLTPPEQETAWIKASPEAQASLRLIVCSIEAARQ